MEFTFFGPVANREITLVVRRRRYYFLRALNALLLLLVFIGAYLAVIVSQPVLLPIRSLGLYAQFADVFFLQFGFVQLAAVLLLTPAYVASSLIVDKQRRTLECLFTTDVWDTEIILGKWLARSLNVVLVLLAGVPVLAFASLLGGIDFSRLGVLSVLALGCLISTAALTLVVAVYKRHVHQALAVTYLLLALLLLGPYAHAQLTAANWKLTHLMGRSVPVVWLENQLKNGSDLLATIEPFSLFKQVMEEDHWWRESSTQLARIILTHGGIAAVCLLWAIVRLRKVYLLELVNESRRRTRRLRRGRVQSLGSFGDRPMLWKEWHFHRHAGQRGARVAWLAIVLLLYFPFMQVIVEHWRGTSTPTWSRLELHDYLRAAGTLLVGLTWIVAATRAAVSLGEERDRDTLSALLLTSLSAGEIQAGKLAGALKPLLLVLTVLLPLWVLAAGQHVLAWSAIPWLLATSLAVGFFFIGIGLHQSLVRRTVLSAVTVTAVAVLFVAMGGQLVLVACLLPFLASLRQTNFGELLRLSLPECLLWEAAYMDGWGPFANSLGGVLVGMICIGVYALVGLLICRRALGRFAGHTDLSDGGNRRSLPWSEIKGLAVQQERQLRNKPDLVCS